MKEPVSRVEERLETVTFLFVGSGASEELLKITVRNTC